MSKETGDIKRNQSEKVKRSKRQRSQPETESRRLVLRKELSLIVPITAIEHRAQLQETIQTTTVSYGEAMSRLGHIGKRLQGRQFAREQGEKVLDLVLHRDSVALAHYQDALEEARLKLGLDEKRDRLFNLLFKTISLPDGLEMFNRGTEAVFGRRYSTFAELAGDFPHLTATEIALLPLVRGVPGHYLAFGNNLDISHIDKFSEMPPNRKNIAPTLIGATTQGLVFSTSEFDFSSQDTPLETDPYSYLGITGRQNDIEVVPFKEEIQQVLERLIPLVFTNNRLHERLWFEARDQALGIGFGRVAEHAYLKCFGKLPDRDLRTRSFKQTIDSLSPDQQREFERVRNLLEENLYRSVIGDLGRDCLLRDDEIFKLLGILAKLPESFSQDEAFHGYIQPYGPGVKIINASGRLLEWVPYNPFFLRQSVYGIYWETVDVSKTNTTFRNIFQQIQSQAEVQILTEGVENNGELSEIEGVKADLQLQYGIDLAILPKTSVLELRKTGDIFSIGISKDGFVERTNSKFTLQEAKDVFAAVRLLPKELLVNVKSIKKITKTSIPIEAYLKGLVREGEYSPDTGEIILYYSCELVPAEAKDAYRLKRMATLLHEIGESVWETLSKEEQEQWRKISWDGEEVDKKAHFLTFYSQFDDERDDFCDHFACFVIHGEEFRQKADKSSPLKLKYQFIAKLLKNRTGRQVEYPKFSPYSIEEIHGILEQEVAKMSLEEAAHAQEEAARKEWREAKREIGEVAKSFEDLQEKAERETEAEEEEDYDVTERQIWPEGDEVDEEEAEELLLADKPPLTPHDLAEVFGQFIAADKALELASLVKSPFDDGDLDEVEEILKNHLTGEEVEEAMAELEELYDSYSQRAVYSYTGFVEEEDWKE